MGLFGKVKKLFKGKTVDEPAKNSVDKNENVNFKEASLATDQVNESQNLDIEQSKGNSDEHIFNDVKKVNKYVAGLDKSRDGFANKVNNLFKRSVSFDEDFFEELENILIMSDISVDMVMTIIDEVKIEVKNNPKLTEAELKEVIADRMFVIYSNWSDIKTSLNIEDGRLNVILMVGVNGAGKTTTIAKLANLLKSRGKKVMVAAGDTFRAGAVAQLDEWAKRLEIECVKPVQENGDPASVMFDACKKAIDENVDVLICDTAGRLQNKINLMNELSKINKVIEREVPGAPHETLLVVDATTGQNGINQAKNFKDCTGLTGIVLTKLDGTSKGGIILSVKEHIDVPVKYVGLGEKMDDLQEFDLETYIYGLLKDWI